MKNIKNEIIQFYKKDYSRPFSNNLWWDLVIHAFIGLTIGFIINELRGVKVAPLLCSVIITLWAFKNHKQKKSNSESK